MNRNAPAHRAVTDEDLAVEPRGQDNNQGHFVRALRRLIGHSLQPQAYVMQDGQIYYNDDEEEDDSTDGDDEDYSE